jgi:hypothetical protein
LRGTSSHFTDEELRLRLLANLDERLRTLAYEKGANRIEGLLPWIQKIRNIDSKRRADRKLIRAFVKEHMRAIEKPFNPSRRSSSGHSATSANPYPPRLTDEERRLLRAHNGCFKCRTFYAEHRSDTCTITLSGVGYSTLNIRDALRAKASKGIA